MTESEAKEVLQLNMPLVASKEANKAMEIAINALEAVQKIKYIINEKHYPDAEECDYGQYYHCEKALMLYDIENVLSDLDSEVRL